MTSNFELFIARRYLRAHRKEKVISIITAISILGVAAGVMALVVALAVNNGFRNTLQRNLLGAMAHISILEKEPGSGIDHWREMSARLRVLPHVTAVGPALYTPVFLTGGLQPHGAQLKGIDVDAELSITEALRHLKQGSLDRLRDANVSPSPILLGSRLVEDTGMVMNSRITLISPQGGELTPIGVRPAYRPFRVVGIFETGFFEIDDNWAYASIGTTQRILGLGDVVSTLELKVDNLDRVQDIAKEVEKSVGSRYTTTTWLERNRQLLGALNMERMVTVITIGLIELVAALNIFITLVMMVMEKYRDIAVLMSMGARQGQIRRIFMMQGVLIGVVGSIIGLIVGYSLCYFANQYRWVRLDETVYSLSFVPFEPRWIDALWVPAAAVLVSFLATVYPAMRATQITPAEVLRYE